MSTKGRPKSEAKNRQIAESAAALFIQNGFSGTSMDDIAERAGVSKQTVYSHFRSKEELFQFVISAKCVSHELSGEFMDPEKPLRDMLRTVAQRFNDLLMSKEAVVVHQLLVKSGDDHPNLPELYYDAGPRRMMRFMSAYLKGQTKLGRLAISDYDIAAEQFLCLVKGTAHMCAILNMDMSRKDEQRNRYLDDCVDMFIRAYESSRQDQPDATEVR